MIKPLIRFLWANAEMFIWAGALLFLFIINPETQHFVLCPIRNLGFSFCPGCGLGHAIHYALWFDFETSIGSHPLGIVAILIIFRRIIQLFYNNIINSYNHGSKSITPYSGH